jgi:short-subunit dehydrogenase
MKILLTGSSSGVGEALSLILNLSHEVHSPSSQHLNLKDSKSIIEYVNQPYDILINCAGTGVGGKTDFVNHTTDLIEEILIVNFLNTVLLTQRVLAFNRLCKIVNITSTNNKRYWPNDLAYSLSKKCLAEFGKMLTVEFTDLNYLEVRLGLTKTNFNNNRYKNNQNKFQDIYATSNYLLPENVARKIVDVLFDNTIKFIEVAP